MLIKKLSQFLSDSSLSDTQKIQLLTLIQQLNATDHNQQQHGEQIQKLINELDGSFIGLEKDKKLGLTLHTDQEELSNDLKATLPHIDLAPTLSPPEDIDSQTYWKDPDKKNTLDESGSKIFIEETEHYKSSLPQEKRIGKYIDLGILGEGGMGEVRKVKDETLKRTLAMKIMHPKFNHNQNAMIRFMEEAQVGAQLQHPNIVPIYELGTLSDGRQYFTMKEIKGIEFKKLIHDVHEASTSENWNPSSSGTTFRRLIQIFHKICETIAYAHSVGVLHRDLKPDNVMIGGFGEVLVVDWGIAKVLDYDENQEEEYIESYRSDGNIMATLMGGLSGTPAYMSPEQARGQVDKIHFTSDIYTLGAILYEILSGRPPFTGRSIVDVLNKVKSIRPPSLVVSQESDITTKNEKNHNLMLEGNNKIPVPLAKICEKAMEQEIENRYVSANQLAMDILNWLEGAQKRDLALAKIKQAEDALDKSKKRQNKSVKFWDQANERITSYGLEDSQGWQLWSESQEYAKQARELDRAHRRLLKAALVHDSKLEEAHCPLVQLLIEEILNATAKGDLHKKEELCHSFQNHINCLNVVKKTKMTEELNKRLGDKITVLRSRQGQLIGRKSQKHDITHKLKSGSNLVSLIGTAGVGKTRLALEISFDLHEQNLETYFCDLTEASDALGIARLVARSMDIHLRTMDPIDQLGDYFSTHNILLVLDNLEQVAQTAGLIIQRWIQQAPSLRMIATSRVKLGITEEDPVFIHPLSSLEAMELFGNRGQRADAHFQLNEKSWSMVGKLVTQLDNLPLAIELAAARLNILKLEEIESKLNERFSLLRSRDQELQTLYGALDWSWGLLQPWEKAVLSQASLFHGGFDLSAAESILNIGTWDDSPPILDILQDLTEYSLLRQDKSTERDIRYGMLESIRQYSNSKLSSLGVIEQNLSGPKAKIESEHRHASYFSQFGDWEYLSSLDGKEAPQQWNTLFLELDNLIAASFHGTGKTASQCALVALNLLRIKGPVSLAVDVVTQLLNRNDIPPKWSNKLNLEQIKCLRISGRIDEARESLHNKNDGFQTMLEIESIVNIRNCNEEDILSSKQMAPRKVDQVYWTEHEENMLFKAEVFSEKGNIEEAEAHYDKAYHCYTKAMMIYEDLQYPKGIVEVLAQMAKVKAYQGDYHTAEQKLILALQLTFDHNLYMLRASIYSGLGSVYKNIGEYENSISNQINALNINREFGNKLGTGINYGHLGNAYQHLGQNEQAMIHYKKAIHINKEIGDKKSLSINIGNVAVVYQNLGHYELAIEHYQQAISISKKIGAQQSLGINLGNLGDLYLKRNQIKEAMKALQDSIEICDEIGFLAAGAFRGSLAVIYAQQNDSTIALQLIKQGEAVIAPIPFEYAKFLCKKAKVYHLSQQALEAQKALQHTQRIALELGIKEDSELSDLIKNTKALLGVS